MEYSRERPSQRYLDLVEQYRRMHAEGEPERAIPPEETFPGRSLMTHAPEVRKLIESTGCENVLDYGSGKGRQYALRNVSFGAEGVWDSIADYWDVNFVDCFDPAYPPYSKLPAMKFHGVVCTDVLEHCPAEDLPWIVEEMFEYAERMVFATVACYPAVKLLPSGENAHCTVRPAEWWEDLFGSTAARHPGVEWRLWIGRSPGASEDD